METAGTPVAISQPKRAALLAYLAVAEPCGLQRRDTLLALLWPDLDQAKARAALNQALYALRQSVGERAIVSRGEGEVGLDWELVRCDAVELRDALTAGRSDDALALYRGPLLAGFHVSGTPEFERWLEAARARLHEQVSEAAWSLAEVETDPTQAARLARPHTARRHTSWPLGESALGSALREWCRVLDRRSRREMPEDVAAEAFSAREREPSFYQGLIGPSLRSALPGGIAYPWGLRTGGRDQNLLGCSPL